MAILLIILRNLKSELFLSHPTLLPYTVYFFAIVLILINTIRPRVSMPLLWVFSPYSMEHNVFHPHHTRANFSCHTILTKFFSKLPFGSWCTNYDEIMKILICYSPKSLPQHLKKVYNLSSALFIISYNTNEFENREVRKF